jgi:hypothetical protein
MKCRHLSFYGTPCRPVGDAVEDFAHRAVALIDDGSSPQPVKDRPVSLVGMGVFFLSARLVGVWMRVFGPVSMDLCMLVLDVVLVVGMVRVLAAVVVVRH